MKKFFFAMLLVMGLVQNANAQGWFGDSSYASGHTLSQSKSASLTIVNKSDYTLTVKILRTNERGLYRTVMISPRSSSIVTFSSTDNFYTKTKAVKDGILGETLYRKGGTFVIQCDSKGYTEGILEFYVSSGSGMSGQGISKAEFEKDK